MRLRTALLLLLMGCAPQRPAIIPELIMLCMQGQDGQYVSAMVDLSRPGMRPSVYLTPGILAVGPDWSQEVTLHEDQLTLSFTGQDAPFVQQVATPSELSLLRIDKGEVVFQDVAGVHRVDARGLSAAQGVVEPGGRQEWRGPLNGFEIQHKDDVLRLKLPRTSGLGVPIMRDVNHLLGAWWVLGQDISAEDMRILRDRFRRIDVIFPEFNSMTVDGNLEEWGSSQATVVDDVSQIRGDTTSWQSDRDASFGVVFRIQQQRAGLAVRIRDDAFLAGQDRLQLVLNGESYEIPIPSEGQAAAPVDGLEVFSSWQGYQSVTFEIGLTISGMETWEHVPLVVEYVDVDSDEEDVILSSAPWPELLDVAAGTGLR